MSKDLDRGSALERFRPLLRLLVRLRAHGQFAGKLDESGVVQETLLDAHRAGDRFPDDPDEQVAWLRRALACNLASAQRHLGAAKRDAGRERSLEAELEESSARLEALLAAEQSSPSEQAVKHERLVRLAAALEQLPDAQREAVILHHLRGVPLAEVARQMGKSEPSVAGLLRRGIEGLRDFLGEDGNPEGAEDPGGDEP